MVKGHIGVMSEPIEICLSHETDYIRINLIKEGGRIVDFQVVYYTVIGGKNHQVVRYDCCHGYPHRDSLYTNPPKKEELPKRPLNELVKDAVYEIKGGWETYKRKYMRLEGKHAEE